MKRKRKSYDNCRPRSSGCSTRGKPRTLGEVVDEYLSVNAPDSDAEYDFYRSCTSLTEAIERASRAEDVDGNCHPHQRRIGLARMSELRAPLLGMKRALQRARNFYQLHELVSQAGNGLERIGPLAIYDTALRLGAYLGFRPQYVYLHCGTREGARALGLKGRAGKIEMQDLPEAFRRLRPDQVEDCLCVYKNEIRRILIGSEA